MKSFKVMKDELLIWVDVSLDHFGNRPADSRFRSLCLKNNVH